jgi:hypothetical protein
LARTLGYAVGRTEQSFWLWHRGETVPRFEVIERLAALFECSPADLSEEDGDV